MVFALEVDQCMQLILRQREANGPSSGPAADRENRTLRPRNGRLEGALPDGSKREDIMAKYVREMMNPEVFSVRTTASVKGLEQQIIALGVSAVPAVDEARVPCGMISLRDLAEASGDDLTKWVMKAPPVIIDRDATLDEAGLLLSRTGVHRLIVVDEDVRLVGMLSAVDLVRGLVGLPAKFPEAFSRYDQQTGMVWSDDEPLSSESVRELCPESAGLFVLIRGGRGIPENVGWAESVENLKGRLLALITTPPSTAMERDLRSRRLRFRWAQERDPDRRDESLKAVAT